MTFSVARPTHVRYTMVLLTMMVAILLYLDRVCLGIAGKTMRQDLGMSENELVWLYSAFSWTYALFQLPAGWLGDRFGARTVLTAYLALWSLCTALMGLAGGFALLLALRLGSGMFEAGGYPLASGVVRRWVPSSARGLASGVVAVGGRLGGAVAPVLTAYLMMLSFSTDSAFGSLHGWSIAFLLYGVSGIAVACFFVTFYRDQPRQHPAVNAAEVALIEGTSTFNVHQAPPRRPPELLNWPPLKEMLLDRSLWLNSFTQFASNYGWVFLITLLPAFFEEVFRISRDQQSWIQTTALCVGIVGMLLGGWLTDRATDGLGRRWGRSLPVVGARAVAGAAFVVCLGFDHYMAVVVAMCLVAFVTDLSNPAAWAYGQDVGGRHVGAVIGWANMWGNLGAAASPLTEILARWFFPHDPAAKWHVVFASFGAVTLMAAVAAIGIDASKPLVVDADERCG